MVTVIENCIFLLKEWGILDWSFYVCRVSKQADGGEVDPWKALREPFLKLWVSEGNSGEMEMDNRVSFGEQSCSNLNLGSGSF